MRSVHTQCTIKASTSLCVKSSVDMHKKPPITMHVFADCYSVCDYALLLGTDACTP